MRKVMTAHFDRGSFTHVNDNMLAGSVFESHPVRGDDSPPEFQGTYTAASCMWITHIHVNRKTIDVNLCTETRPLSRNTGIENQLTAQAAQAEQTFDAESP